MQGSIFIVDCRTLAPAHMLAQEKTFEWLADAHTRAEQTVAEHARREFDAAEFRSGVLRRLRHFGCPKDKIQQRGHQLADCGHTDWEQMEIYRLHERPMGGGSLARTRAYASATDGVFARLYAESTEPPSDILHVTCTGYASPSCAQRLVANRGWGRRTRVTHAYHMGCYAALPAVRLAAALVGAKTGERVDVVHTELCSLHLNPALHTPEQFVIQSLFADGFAVYTLAASPRSRSGHAALELLAQEEELLPESSESMTWVCGDFGMQMSLAHDVPERLALALRDFVARLCQRAGLSEAERKSALFAVHPGGPRIVDLVQKELRLADAQLEVSRRVLLNRGNMSSATLPHIWSELARSDAAPHGVAIVSLAFGPGLTLCGAVVRKVGS